MLEKKSELDARCGQSVFPQWPLVRSVCLHWVRGCLQDLETCDSAGLNFEIILH